MKRSVIPDYDDCIIKHIRQILGENGANLFFAYDSNAYNSMIIKIQCNIISYPLFILSPAKNSSDLICNQDSSRERRGILKVISSLPDCAGHEDEIAFELKYGLEVISPYREERDVYRKLLMNHFITEKTLKASISDDVHEERVVQFALKQNSCNNSEDYYDFSPTGRIYQAGFALSAEGCIMYV